MPVAFLADTEKSTGDIVLWSSILIIAMVALFGVLVFYRKWMNAPDTTSSGPAFTLSDLRRLHKEGKMTTEEYEKAKAAIVGSLKKAAAAAGPGAAAAPRAAPSGPGAAAGRPGTTPAPNPAPAPAPAPAPGPAPDAQRPRKRESPHGE